MRMTPAQARAIQRGAKTQHRHPVDPRLLVTPLHAATRHSGRPFVAAVGDIVPVDSDQRTYFKVAAVSRGPLGTITPEDAKAEGYETPDEFEIAWIERHERPWLDRQVQYLIEQNIPEGEAEETRDAWAKVRYQHHWTDREIWLLEVVPFNDMPYLLPGLPDEPEGIPAEKLNRRWDIKAGRKHQAAHAEVLDEKLAACLTVEERIAVIRREAHKQGRDIRTHLRAIDRRIEDMAKLLQIDKAA